MTNNPSHHNFTISLFCEGNNDAIVVFYKELMPQLYLIAYRYLKSQEDAEDVVANCFEKLLKMSVEERKEMFIINQLEIKAVLIVIVKSKSLDALKKKTNRFRIVDTLKNWMPSTTSNTSSAFFTNEDFSVLSNSLSDKERTILKLNIEGYTHQEICSQLHISEKTVSNTLSLSRKKIKNLWSVFMN